MFTDNALSPFWSVQFPSLLIPWIFEQYPQCILNVFLHECSAYISQSDDRRGNTKYVSELDNKVSS